jgi:hypothetical protein
MFAFLDKLEILQHSNNTAILRTSKQIHREAYDVLVKTNKFVHVTTSAGIPIRFLLNHLRVPMVTEDKARAEQFQGYVLSVALTGPRDIGKRFERQCSTTPCSLMMLGRDMDVFCDILADGNVHIPSFGTKVSLQITVAPNISQALPAHKESILPFFSEKTQELLLQPFRTRLRDFKNVKVAGQVSPSIAAAAEEEIAQDFASDPEAVINQFQAAKDEGHYLFKLNKKEEACLRWQDATLEIENLQNGSSWNTLTKKGAVPFVARLAEIYFLMKLNTVHLKIAGMEKGELYADLMAEDALQMATNSLRKDHWMPDFQWRPTAAHMAKLQYRRALFLRLQADPEGIDSAVRAIKAAHRLLPEDAVIMRERTMILAWRDAFR